MDPLVSCENVLSLSSQIRGAVCDTLQGGLRLVWIGVVVVVFATIANIVLFLIAWGQMQVR